MSPLYTEIMGKDKDKPEVNGSPQVPQDNVKSSDSNEVGLPADEEAPEVPEQNFTKEDLEQLNLSKVCRVLPWQRLRCSGWEWFGCGFYHIHSFHVKVKPTVKSVGRGHYADWSS